MKSLAEAGLFYNSTYYACLMSARALPILLFVLLASTASAQTLKSYWGPTLGISAPSLWRSHGLDYVIPHRGYAGRVAPLPGPIAGANAGITVEKHLAFDAALQYSYAGRSYVVDFEPPYADFIHEERLRFHKISLPLAVGYAGDIGRTHIRLGIGCALNYLVAGRARIDFTAAGPNGTTFPARAIINPFDETIAQRSGSRVHVLPRASLSIVPTDRWLITAAYNHGRSRPIALPPLGGGLFSSIPRNSAIDLTATYLLKSIRTSRQSSGE